MNIEVASIYDRQIPSTLEATTGEQQAIRMTLWRNETGAARFLLQSDEDCSPVWIEAGALKGEKTGHRIPREAATIRRIRPVKAGEHGSVLDPLERFDSLTIPAGEIQSLWLSVRVPEETKADTYRGEIRVLASENDLAVVSINVEVLPLALPEPEDYSFWLDLWQHPASVARVHDLPLWSEAHWVVLDDTLRMLAEAGQKVITATIIHDPWGSQTWEPHESMVTWYREPDGTLAFDFSIFDRYVETCMKAGIRDAIHCYSTCLGPGKRTDCVFRVVEDRSSGRFQDIVTRVGDEVYRNLWKQFFAAFVPHLRERGWLDRTGIGMDEKPPEVMNLMLAMLRESAPELRVALAGRYHEELGDRVWDYCVFYPGAERETSAARAKTGRKTTFYTCCGPPSPNTFTHSPPVEARQLPWHAAASGLDGYLRWAYNAWNESPLEDTAFGNWSPGDCFLIYPGPRSSIRFEMLKTGIQDFEAIRYLRSRLPESSPERAELEAAVRRAAENIEDKAEAARRVEEARTVVNSVALRLAAEKE